MRRGKNNIHFTKDELKKRPVALLNPWLFHPDPELKNDAAKQVQKSNATNNKGQKIKSWIFMQLYAYCKANNLWLIAELEFHPTRNYRFDWAIMYNITEQQIINKTWSTDNQVAAIEYEGLMSAKSGHTTVTGFTKDTEKYNDAVHLGWPLIRITVLNHKDLFKILIPTIEKFKQQYEKR